MQKKWMVWILLVGTALSFEGCGSDDSTQESNLESTTHLSSRSEMEQTHNMRSTLAYYGDKENNRIVVVDIDAMSLIESIDTGHQKSYAAEVVQSEADKHAHLLPKLYVDNRGSNIMDVIDTQTNSIIKSIALPFYPRSINYNALADLVLVSGVDRAMSAVIDVKTDEVIATVGNSEVTYPTTSGHAYISSGTLASGHPEWLNANTFVQIDREHREIDTYVLSQEANGSWKTRLLNRLKTPSPVHNLIPPEIHGQGGHGHEESNLYSTIFYATAEGAEGVYPSVLKLAFIEGEGLSIEEELLIKKEGLSPDIMGVHHLNFLKNQHYIYVGSDEGNLFIVDYTNSPMRIEKIVSAGKGAGHTTEFEHGDIAVVINHKDTFITLMNTAINEKIADILVSKLDLELLEGAQTQSHPAYHFSKDGRYFYLFLTEEGALVKVDLIEKRIVERLEIGGKLSMGSFIEF